MFGEMFELRARKVAWFGFQTWAIVGLETWLIAPRFLPEIHAWQIATGCTAAYFACRATRAFAPAFADKMRETFYPLAMLTNAPLVMLLNVPLWLIATAINYLPTTGIFSGSVRFKIGLAVALIALAGCVGFLTIRGNAKQAAFSAYAYAQDAYSAHQSKAEADKIWK